MSNDCDTADERGEPLNVLAAQRGQAGMMGPYMSPYIMNVFRRLKHEAGNLENLERMERMDAWTSLSIIVENGNDFIYIINTISSGFDFPAKNSVALDINMRL